MTGRDSRADGAGRAEASPRQAAAPTRGGGPKGRLPDGDDGRTIVDMNVEGMPWYAPERPGAPRRGAGEDAPRQEIPLTREESRFFTWGALKAALLVTGAMCLGIILFVLFCQLVWFR